MEHMKALRTIAIISGVLTILELTPFLLTAICLSFLTLTNAGAWAFYSVNSDMGGMQDYLLAALLVACPVTFIVCVVLCVRRIKTR